MEENETVLVSACLLGARCKWDQADNRSQKVIDYVRKFQVIPVCPEQLGGLPTPRPPAERKGSHIYTKEGADVTDSFKSGAEKVLNLAHRHGCKKAILKQRSPSCGCGKVYDGTFSGRIISGNGITAEELLKAGIEVSSEEDL